jgi:hypothetical protein
MDTVTENEKQTLIEKGPDIRVRPVAKADAPAIMRSCEIRRSNPLAETL